jgi:hypothetical protein
MLRDDTSPVMKENETVSFWAVFATESQSFEGLTQRREGAPAEPDQLVGLEKPLQKGTKGDLSSNRLNWTE